MYNWFKIRNTICMQDFVQIPGGKCQNSLIYSVKILKKCISLNTRLICRRSEHPDLDPFHVQKIAFKWGLIVFKMTG
jgi:hypothetical protein